MLTIDMHRLSHRPWILLSLLSQLTYANTFVVHFVFFGAVSTLLYSNRSCGDRTIP